MSLGGRAIKTAPCLVETGNTWWSGDRNEIWIRYSCGDISVLHTNPVIALWLAARHRYIVKAKKAICLGCQNDTASRYISKISSSLNSGECAVAKQDCTHEETKTALN